jgi:hypothetical protein
MQLIHRQEKMLSQYRRLRFTAVEKLLRQAPAGRRRAKEKGENAVVLASEKTLSSQMKRF